MRKFIKPLALATLVGAVAIFSSCDIEDAITDNFTDDLPKSFLGTWVDANDNEVILNSGNITVGTGEKEKFKTIVLITSNGVDVYACDTNDEDNTSDYYIKQPGSTDELEISTVAVSTTEYTTYTKVQ